MKHIHIYLFGIGNVGNTLIDQIQQAHSFFKKEYQLDIKLVFAGNSKKALFDKNGIETNWKQAFDKTAVDYSILDVYDFAGFNSETRILIDATASNSLSLQYIEIVNAGFHIVTANKIANTLPQDFYDALRVALHKNNLTFLYETNVGAGLPIIETLKTLFNSGEQIHAVNGVFSGSLSYIFNTFSSESIPFSEVVKTALDSGYTEPDPREDLSGNDVARKLLVLAREVGLKLNIEDVSIENLVIPSLRTASLNLFLSSLNDFDAPFQNRKDELEPEFVLRHLGKLDVKQKTLQVTLEKVMINSPAGQLKGSDAFFEIYSSSYPENPLVISGAGAGRAVTARGLLSDIIKIAQSCRVTKKLYA